MNEIEKIINDINNVINDNNTPINTIFDLIKKLNEEPNQVTEMITNCNPNQIKLLKSLLSLHNTYQNKNREGEEEGKRLILKGLLSIFKNIKIEDYMNDNNFWITVNKILPYSNLPYVPNYGNRLVLFLDILGFADLVNQLSKYESKRKLINILHNNIRKFFY